MTESEHLNSFYRIWQTAAFRFGAKTNTVYWPTEDYSRLFSSMLAVLIEENWFESASAFELLLFFFFFMSGRKEIEHTDDGTLMCKEVNYLNHQTERGLWK